MDKGKAFKISKHLIAKAYKLVKENKGAPGVDGISLEEYEATLKDNLYKLWNRMSSGSYLPSPVRTVEIPKKTGGIRVLGIPTVEDRIAQMAFRLHLEPDLEKLFLEDSYGYRPNKSAIDAVGVARKRCWSHDWVIEFDIKKLFDRIDHELMLKAIEKHTEEKWVMLYAKRLMCAPFQMPDGTQIERTSGLPQGGVCSPLLANLFLHYAFDRWIVREFPQCPWERYADDALIHCKTKAEAQQLLECLKQRLEACHLELHPEKTKIVYCKDSNRKGLENVATFEFLGYEFRTRTARQKNGQYFQAFTPAVSKNSKRGLREKIREIKRKAIGWSLERLAETLNPIIRGWANYFCHFNKGEMKHELGKINLTLTRWAMMKYKKLKRRAMKASDWLGRCAKYQPQLFEHWKMGITPAF